MKLLECETIQGKRVFLQPYFMTHCVELPNGIRVYFGEDFVDLNADMDSYIGMVAKILKEEREEEHSSDDSPRRKGK